MVSENKNNVEYWEDFWSQYWKPSEEKINLLKRSFEAEKVLGMGLMPVRGNKGFRKLDYEFAKKLPVNEIMDRLESSYCNILGVVIKDTDGACMWDTQKGWNPTGRDILGEFVDAGKDRNIKIMVSFTSMNDAYAGYKHPDRVSVHGKGGKRRTRDESGNRIKEKYQAGDISTHDEGEMRVDLPEGVTFKEYQKTIPFLQNKMDPSVGSSRGARGKGYIPSTSFMCPNSDHVDYLVDLAEEVVKNYDIRAFFADYIRYDGAYTDLCMCNHCKELFSAKYGNNRKMKGSDWYDFKEDTIALYAKKLCEKIKSIDTDCITGWFSLTGPPLFTRNRLGQNWTKLGQYFDAVSPMIYPYLMGTNDDGKWWGFVGAVSHWYSIKNMQHRIAEYGDQAVLAITNSVECNAEEMLKQ
ncbi:MAG: hypothetical protein GF364_20860, partial [Candidatus Lokiarchaeota archaeon]|nr:hypothetical protein [Candidatus Lokiarchaeota archaeon]